MLGFERALRRLIPLIALGLLPPATFAACSDGDGGGNSSASSLIDAQCAAFDACCQAKGEASDPQSCKAFYAIFGAGSTLGPNAAECEALLRERTADGSYCTLGAVKDGVDICHNALGDPSGGTNTGTKPPGAACNDDDECLAPAGGEARCSYRTTFDENNQATTTQTCVQLTKGGAGEGPCSATVGVDGSSTSYGSSSPPLNTTVECYQAEGLFCPQYGEQCQTYAAIGAECSGNTQQCNPLTSYCRFGSGDGGAPSSCAALLALGEACSPGDECVADAGCQNEVCTKLKANGEACAVSSECASHSCVNQKCEGYGGGTLCFH
jgi:hypothetical protein